MTSAPTAFVTVYTDGSAINHGQSAKTRAGYGIYYGQGNSNNVSAPLKGPDQSSSRAEVQAIVVALQRALSGGYTIVIRSDAGTVIDVLNGLSTPSANTDLVNQAKQTIEEMRSNRLSVKLEKVSREQNADAHKLAVEGANKA